MSHRFKFYYLEPAPFADYRVVSWNGSDGWARPVNSNKKKDDVAIAIKDVVTDGIEELRVGSIIRGRRVPGDYQERNSLAEIEIYVLPEPNFASFVPGVKRYQSEDVA